MVRQRRVVILCHSPLFAASLKTFLDSENGLEVFIEEVDGPQVSWPRRTVRPHVLIIEEDESQPGIGSTSTREDAPTIIRLSLKDNDMRVSHEQRISPATGEDLIKAIRNGRLVPRRRRERQEAGL